MMLFETRGGAVAAHDAHNVPVPGSIPGPATIWPGSYLRAFSWRDTRPGADPYLSVWSPHSA